MDDLIKLETAKLAKEKGFNKVCRHAFQPTNHGYFPVTFSIKSDLTERYANYYLRPKQSDLQKWLRDKNIIIEIKLDQTSYLKYCFNVYKYEDFGNWEDIYNSDWGLYSSYEKALEDALVLGLQNVS